MNPTNDSMNFTVTKIGHIHYRMADPNWNLVDVVNPDHFILAYAESGKAHYLLDGQDVTIGADEVVFFQVGEPHTAWVDPEEPWRYFSLSFELLFLDEAARQRITSAKTLHAPHNRLRCRSLLFSIYWAWTNQKPGYYLAVRSLLMELLREILKELSDVEQGVLSASWVWEYRENSAVIGKEITVSENKNSYTATATDILPSGALCVRLSDGTEKELYGQEITLRLSPNAKK